MRLSYNFKVGSLFEWRGIPIRIIVLVILIPSLVTYYCSGFMSMKRDLPLKVWSCRQGAHPSKFKWLGSEFLVKG